MARIGISFAPRTLRLAPRIPWPKVPKGALRPYPKLSWIVSEPIVGVHGEKEYWYKPGHSLGLIPDPSRTGAGTVLRQAIEFNEEKARPYVTWAMRGGAALGIGTRDPLSHELEQAFREYRLKPPMVGSITVKGRHDYWWWHEFGTMNKKQAPDPNYPLEPPESIRYVAVLKRRLGGAHKDSKNFIFVKRENNPLDLLRDSALRWWETDRQSPRKQGEADKDRWNIVPHGEIYPWRGSFYRKPRKIRKVRIKNTDTYSDYNKAGRSQKRRRVWIYTKADSELRIRKLLKFKDPAGNIVYRPGVFHQGARPRGVLRYSMHQFRNSLLRDLQLLWPTGKFEIDRKKFPRRKEMIAVVNDNLALMLQTIRQHTNYGYRYPLVQWPSRVRRMHWVGGAMSRSAIHAQVHLRDAWGITYAV